MTLPGMSYKDTLYVSVNEFAHMVGLSSRTVWRLVAVDCLPSLLIGRRRLLPIEASIAALERCGSPSSVSLEVSSQNKIPTDVVARDE